MTHTYDRDRSPEQRAVKDGRSRTLFQMALDGAIDRVAHWATGSRWSAPSAAFTAQLV